MKKTTLIILTAIIVSFLIAIVIYPKMPAQIASHWNDKGVVNGYMSKLWGLFLMPLISVFLFLLFLVIPRIDPYKKNIDKFRGYFDNFLMIIILFLFYVYLLTILWNLGARFNFIQMLSPAFAIIFYYAGVLIKHAKRNWFIGIRTPWTLSNEKVWDKTHKLGAKLFKTCGIISLLGIILPNYAIWFILIPVIASAIYIMIYSYLEFRKLNS